MRSIDASHLNVPNAKIVEALLSNGADAKRLNNKGSSLLHFVAYAPMLEEDKRALAGQLISHGVDVNRQVRPTQPAWAPGLFRPQDATLRTPSIDFKDNMLRSNSSQEAYAAKR